MSESIIFCYSGGGNCLDMAKRIAEKMGDTDIVMMRRKPTIVDASHAKRIGFCFPNYGGGAPADLLNYTRLIKMNPNAYVFGIQQFAGYPGNAMYQMNEIVHFDYWAYLTHQCGYIELFPHYFMIPPMPASAAQIKAQVRYRKIAKDILNGVKTEKQPKLHKWNQLENKAWPALAKMNSKKLRVYHDKCISCGQCATICPKGNIELKDGKPTFGTDCYQCLSCLHYCPQQAIYLKGIAKHRSPYHNKNISAAELNKDVIHVG